VQDTQRAVTIGFVLRHDAKRHDVGHLLEADVALGHFAPDAERMFFAARHFNLEARFGERLLDGQRYRIDLPPVLRAQLLEPVVDGAIGFGLELLESEQLHFPHVFVHAHPLS